MERNIDTPQNVPPHSNEMPLNHLGALGRFLRRIPLGVYGLVTGILGLALAAIPSIAMERSLPNPFETPEQTQRRIHGPPRKEGGVTLRFKGLSLNFGGKEIKSPIPPNNSFTNDPLRWFMIAATLFGLIGLALCSVAHVREKQTAITLTGMGCSIAAITWQFLIFGIVLGVVLLFVLLFMLSVRI